MEDIEKMVKDLVSKLTKELVLKNQELEQRIARLENGEFGTGVYLQGCTEADAEYISAKPIINREKEGD